jgi:hypothetical protein
MDPITYPWFGLVGGDDIEQGDILEGCPVYQPPTNIVGGKIIRAKFKWEKRNVIILSQSCDLVKGREKTTEVLLCAVWDQSQLTGSIAELKNQEAARRGNLPGWHVLATCDVTGFQRQTRFADLRRTYSLPVEFLRKQAMVDPQRLRLLPPYREHLSQSFARLYMRVGLPIDIPPFTK